MQVADFCQCVSHRIVNCTLANLTTFYMSDRYSHADSRCRCRQQLVAIGDEQENVGSHPVQNIGQTHCCNADSPGHTRVCVRTQQALDPLINRETRRFDIVYRHPELGAQVRAHCYKPQFEIIVFTNAVQQPIQMCEISTGRRQYGDTAWF